MLESIQITATALAVTGCESVIVVPEIAIAEAGYIKTFTTKDGAHAKHEFHALSQMAYFQFQDDELAIVEIDAPMTISRGEEHNELPKGLVIYRDLAGQLHVLAHRSQNCKKLLETAYRYCTRWVRLDI